MKVLIEIPDNEQGQSFLNRARKLSYVQKAEKLTSTDLALLQEIRQIREAHRLAAQVKAGKLRTRPVRDLLDDL